MLHCSRTGKCGVMHEADAWRARRVMLIPVTVLQEKTDHLGIVALILGTPITALMSHTRGGIPLDLQISGGVMLGAAFLPPMLRVLGFTVGVLAMVMLHFRTVMNLNLAVQLLLYGLGACSFLR